MLVERSLGSTITDAFSSPPGLALQVLMLLGLVALVRVDRAAVLRRHRRGALHG